MSDSRHRPTGIAALAALFGFGALASAFALATIASPGSALDQVWRVNPEGHAALLEMGRAAGWLMGIVCACCAAAAFGTWAGKRWGYLLACAMLVVNLCGAVAEGTMGGRPEALWGVPVVLCILAYLRLSSTREYFQERSRSS
jgi:hypothetical protein